MDRVVHFVLVQAENGQCGFPKGHVESNETEVETALRETWEEVSVRAVIQDDFRKEIQYLLLDGSIKKAIYYLASFDCQTTEPHPSHEVARVLVLPYKEARGALTYDNAREILDIAHTTVSENR